MRFEPAVRSRSLRRQRMSADIVVVGGGMAGTCCAVTAARAGASVILVQDRPVLGGNASSEVRLWVLGATSHMGNNNRWAREGGVIDEVLIENLWRNREGNPVLFDAILLEKATLEKRLTLLLNTSVNACRKSSNNRIVSVQALNSQNSSIYDVSASLFCDASGDGVLGFLAGASYRIGAERGDEFGERFAPDPASYGECLGHSIYFYTRDTGKPVDFVPPHFALKDIEIIPRWRNITARDQGCRYWWFEWGGRLDTVHDTEQIKWELWKVAYGAWNHIKNSGRFPEARNMTLEWVGLIPGKRESRRFMGPAVLTQQDIIQQRQFPDAVSFGGWSIDLHPADGVYSKLPSCDQWHAKGVYEIPYRCLYSRDVPNLFLAGRLISVSHVAFGSTRVMATCANSAQAAGMAAALCARDGSVPADLASPERVGGLRRALAEAGQHIPGFRAPSEAGLAARIEASSSLELAAMAPDGPWLALDASWAQLLPLTAGAVPRFGLTVRSDQATTLIAELRTSSRPGNFTPDRALARREIPISAGAEQQVGIEFGVAIDLPQYGFLCLLRNPAVSVKTTQFRCTGLLSVRHSATQRPVADIGIESFELWTPVRRPGGHNLAVTIDPPLRAFGPRNVVNGVARPTTEVNAWVADPSDRLPTLSMAWSRARKIRRVVLAFDTDFDHPLESVQWGHPERAIPFCVKHFRLVDGAGNAIWECVDNHQTRCLIDLAAPIETSRLAIELLASHGSAPASLFEVRVTD